MTLFSWCSMWSLICLWQTTVFCFFFLFCMCCTFNHPSVNRHVDLRCVCVCVFWRHCSYSGGCCHYSIHRNQGKDLAAWHCKSFIDRLALNRAAIVMGFSYWCLSVLALNALTSGVKVTLRRVHYKTPRPRRKWGKSAYAGLELRVCAALAVLRLWVRKKRKQLSLVARHRSTARWIDLASPGM